jgi:hypothetical protein
MKAILRRSAALLSLLLLSSVSHGQVAYSPVFKTPLAQAPSPSNSGVYVVDVYGNWTGPHYYLVPSCRPFNGILPGATGQAIMSGNLPHKLLLSKAGMDIGCVPMLGHKQSEPGPSHAGNGEGIPPMMGGGNPMTGPSMQIPYGPMPTSPYPRQAPYPQPMPMMPYAGAPQPYPQPMPQARPIAYMPYYGAPGMYAMARQNPQTGIWQVQNIMPGQGATPFMSIPSFNPGMPANMPMQNQPMMPPQGMGQFGPMQSFNQFGPVQGPQPPQMNWQGMQLPRMEMMPPPPPRPSQPYPTHPFTRSPRDFFMWGEVMDEERARGNRPFPVP